MKKILILLCMFIGLYGCTADNTDTDSTATTVKIPSLNSMAIKPISMGWR